MTSADVTTPPRAIPAPVGQRAARIFAFDHLRGLIILLVVLHHAVLAYCRYSHFDRQHYLWSSAPIVDGPGWLGFDVLVLFNDSYFMPLMFLLSGLFVIPSIVRKGARGYLRDRMLRLGVPFIAAVLTVIPLAYYPSFLMAGHDIGFPGFWVQMIVSGPWPSGPAWFIGVLLVFDGAAVAVFAVFGHRGLSVAARSPRVCFAVLIGLSALAYLPALALFGPAHWFAFGPWAVQASRVMLYALYFAAGCEAGRCGFEHGILSPDGPLPRSWPHWVSLAALIFTLFVGLQSLRLTGWLFLTPSVWLGVYGVYLILFCASASFALLAVFRRFHQQHSRMWDSLAADAYGIYILHYPVVVWLQYALVGARLTVIAKAALVFPAALMLSWGGTIILRRIPGAARII